MRDVLLLLVILVLNNYRVFVTAQNCAIPTTVTLPRDERIRRECASPAERLDPDAILANLTVHRVQSYRIVEQSAEGFAKAELVIPDGGTDGKAWFILSVDNSLCKHSPILLDNNEAYGDDGYHYECGEYPPGGMPMTIIDESWEPGVEVVVEFECLDGRKKKTTFIIPIHDENTQPPLFQHHQYTLVMGPCVNGTHQGSCPLNFETPILAFDSDRDFENADMDFFTVKLEGEVDPKNLIIYNASVLVYRRDDTPPPGFLSLPQRECRDRNSKAHVLNVRLYLKENEEFDEGSNFKFSLIARNKKSQVWGNDSICTCEQVTVHLHFNGSLTGGGGGGGVTPITPTFGHKAYHVSLTEWSNREGQNLTDLIKPERIQVLEAMNGLGYGDTPVDNATTSAIRYSVLYCNEVRIDASNGNITLAKRIEQLSPDKSVVCYVKAMWAAYPFISAMVPLMLFLKQDESTPCPTLPGGECPECPTVCPVLPTCPGNGSSTTAMTPNVTTTTFYTTQPPHQNFTTTNGWSTSNATSHTVSQFPTTSRPTSTFPTSDSSPIFSSTQTTSRLPTTGIRTTPMTPITSTPHTSTTSDSTNHPTPDTTAMSTLDPPITEAVTSTITTTPDFTSTSAPSTYPSTFQTMPTSTQTPYPTSNATIRPTTIDSPTSHTTITTSTTFPDSSVATTINTMRPTNPTTTPATTTITTTTTPTGTSTITTSGTTAPVTEHENPTDSVTYVTTESSNDTCCKKCIIIPDFECPTQDELLRQGLVNVSLEGIKFPDPHNCDIFWTCGPDGTSEMFECSTNETFCPSDQKCMGRGQCSCSDPPDDGTCEKPEELPYCESCQNNCVFGENPPERENICYNSSLPGGEPINVADPKFYDIFHNCNWQEGQFADCTFQCAPSPGHDLMFCTELQNCDYKIKCGEEVGDRWTYQCDPCRNFYMNVYGISLDLLWKRQFD